MKKTLLLASCFGLAATLPSFSQGLVDFTNYFNPGSPAVGIHGGVADFGGVLPTITGNNPGLGPDYSAQLAYYIGLTTNPSQLTPLNYNFYDGFPNASPVQFGLGIAATNGDIGSGLFEGGQVRIPGITPANANNITFEVLILQNGAVIGKSSLFSGRVTARSTDATPNLPQGSWQTSIVIAPEPSTFTVIGLAGAALLIQRRNRRRNQRV